MPNTSPPTNHWSGIEEDLLQGLMRREQRRAADMAMATAALLEVELRIMGLNEDAAVVKAIIPRINSYQPKGWPTGEPHAQPNA